MTGIWEAIWVIICFWPLTLVALTTSTSAPWAIIACIWFIWMTGSLFAAWNNSLNPCLSAISFDWTSMAAKYGACSCCCAKPTTTSFTLALTPFAGPSAGVDDG